MHNEKIRKRFWEKVDKNLESGCWEWTAQIAPNGYGRFYTDKNTSAHRASWEIHYGKIPKRMLVCHRCDNKKCVNPKHLFVGTNKDNLEDMRIKGRSLRGEKNTGSKLNRSQVKQIRAMLNKGINQEQIAREFEVAKNTVSRISTRERWGWLR